jgi:HK97 gp10 family phage protein
MFGIRFNKADFQRDVERGASPYIRFVALNIAERMKFLMASPDKSGRAYRKRGGRIHIASAPGQAPAIDTGRLLRSIGVVFRSLLSAVIPVDAPYASYLEKGTAKMAARPFAEPAINDVLERVERGALFEKLGI